MTPCISLLGLSEQTNTSHNKSATSHNKNLFSHSCGGWKVQDQGISRLGFWWGFSPWLTDSLCLHMVFLLCTHTLGISSSYVRMPILLGKGPTLITSFILNYFLKTLFQMQSHWRLELQHKWARGGEIQSTIQSLIQAHTERNREEGARTSIVGFLFLHVTLTGFGLWFASPPSNQFTNWKPNV